MSDQPEPQVEQPTEQVEEPKPPRRTRGPNKIPGKTSDPNYFKDYYKNKTKPKVYVEENKINCPLCNKKTYLHTLKRHQGSKSCRLYRLEQEQHQQTISL
jgi:hypothetical protein